MRLPNGKNFVFEKIILRIKEFFVSARLTTDEIRPKTHHADEVRSNALRLSDCTITSRGN